MWEQLAHLMILQNVLSDELEPRSGSVRPPNQSVKRVWLYG